MNPVTKIINQAVKDNVFPGAVLLVSINSKIEFYEAFGKSDIFSNTIMTKDTIFDLASLTKPLATSLAILKLVQDGIISVKQNIGSIIKALSKTSKADITIDELLRHRSGLCAHKPFYKDLIKMPWEKRRSSLRNFIIKEPLVYKKGTRELYSDLGFMLLSWVVETVSKKRLDYFILDEIYSPLKLKELFFIDISKDFLIDDKIRQRIASTEKCPWRNKILKAEVHDDNAWAVGGIEGHAGLFGTVFEVWILLMEIMYGLQQKQTKIIHSNLLKKFIEKKGSDSKVAGFEIPSNPSASGKYFSLSSVGHLGFTGTSFWIDPEKSVIIIFFTNRVHPLRNNEKIKVFRPLLHDLIMEFFLHHY